MQINTDYIKSYLLERTEKPYFPYCSLQEFIEEYKNNCDHLIEYPCPCCNGTGTIHITMNMNPAINAMMEKLHYNIMNIYTIAAKKII
jgi:hypothetical protein